MNTRSIRRAAILMRKLGHFGRDTTAATSIEYALIAGGIALAIVAIVAVVGTNLVTPYQTIATGLNNLNN